MPEKRCFLGDVAKLIIKRFYMKRTFVKSLVCIVPMLLLTLATMAQGVVKGKVIDSQTKEELIGATVMVQGTGEWSSDKFRWELCLGNC